MISNDHQQYLTVELFNAKIDALMAQISLENEKLRSELKAEIQSVRSDVRVNSAQIAELHHFMYWGIAILALIVTVVPFFRREHKQKKQKQTQQQFTTHSEVKDMISQALSTLNSGGKATM